MNDSNSIDKDLLAAWWYCYTGFFSPQEQDDLRKQRNEVLYERYSDSWHGDAEKLRRV